MSTTTESNRRYILYTNDAQFCARWVINSSFANTLLYASGKFIFLCFLFVWLRLLNSIIYILQGIIHCTQQGRRRWWCCRCRLRLNLIEWLYTLHIYGIFWQTLRWVPILAKTKQIIPLSALRTICFIDLLTYRLQGARQKKYKSIHIIYVRLYKNLPFTLQ